MPKPGVLFAPEALYGLKEGFDQLANLLALTLGPAGGNIATDFKANREVERFADAATAARRILEVPGRAQNVGAMLVRNLVWRVHKDVGDGTATAAVLAQALLDEGFRIAMAGANPMILREGIGRGLKAALQALEEMAVPVTDEEELTGLALAVTGEPRLSLVLGELFDVLGPDAHIIIEEYVAPYVEREYFEGSHWKAELASPYLVTHPPTRRCIVENPLVVVYDGFLTEWEEVEPLLRLLDSAEGERDLLIAAKKVAGQALAAFVVNHQAGRLRVAAVQFSSQIDRKRRDLFYDLALQTGATVLGPEVGRPLQSITWGDMGRAARAEADPEKLVVVAGQGDRAALQEHLEGLRRSLEQVEDEDERATIRERIARLSGGVAVLKIGDASRVGQAELRQKAEKAIKSLALAAREGAVPGGGVAFLNCVEAVRSVEAQGDAAVGVRVLARALEAPFRRIVQNAGVHAPAVILHEARRRGPDFGYDALRGEVVNLREAGILDATGVCRRALEIGTSAAMMALTIAAIVLHRKPEKSMEP
ncbi:MAG: chaperonin GroEL [Anaerolineae bacterium]